MWDPRGRVMMGSKLVGATRRLEFPYRESKFVNEISEFVNDEHKPLKVS